MRCCWVSVKRGFGAGVRGLSFFKKKECCFRVSVWVRVDTNPNPNLPLEQHSFKNKNIDPGPPPDHAFYWHPVLCF